MIEYFNTLTTKSLGMKLLENGDGYLQEFQKIKHPLTEYEIIVVADVRAKSIYIIMEKENIRIAKVLLDVLDNEEIASVTGVPLECIGKLRNEVNINRI